MWLKKSLWLVKYFLSTWFTDILFNGVTCFKKWKKHICKLLNIYGSDVKQTETDTYLWATGNASAIQTVIENVEKDQPLVFLWNFSKYYSSRKQKNSFWDA